MGKLILVRHGQSSGNRDRLYGADPHALPLTELGYEQARAAARVIAAAFTAELVVSSPYLRAHETARIIAEMLSLPLEVEPELYERAIGIYEGLSYDSIRAAPDYDATQPWRFTPKGGESYEAVQRRVAPILDRLAKAHPERDVVVVSHGGVMMTLWAYVTGTWANAHVPPNCGIIVIEHTVEGYLPPRIIGATDEAFDAGG